MYNLQQSVANFWNCEH